MRLLKPAIGPLQLGPFVRDGGRIVIGQWGLIPEGSSSRKPTLGGRPVSTNNARFDQAKGTPEKHIFRGAWTAGRRCIIPAETFDEPYWGHGGPKCIWWRFRRRDGLPWAIAGVWNEWTDFETGEVVPSYTMLTINCNAHPLLRLMHRPDTDKQGNVLPPDQQDKRTVVPLEREDLDAWLHGSPAQAAALVRLARMELYEHGAVEPAQQVELPVQLELDG